jgi:hypothetical protein
MGATISVFGNACPTSRDSFRLDVIFAVDRSYFG